VTSRAKACCSTAGDFVRQDRRQLLALQPFQEQLQHLAVRAQAVALFPVGAGRVVRHRAQQRDAIDEQALGAHLGGGVQEQAVGRAQLLAEHLGAGEDELQPVLLRQALQVPPERRSVADELAGGHLEGDHEAWLLEVGDAPVDEFQAQERLAGAGGAFHQDHIPRREAAL
jgi:hypothetical protein